ncbi:MAG: ATP-dependent DNA helicase RecQ [Planctomycetales bacterium]|nr:ATP-dependent DNA helicase RecQ [Planctomycetales bacterium]
MSHRTEDNLIHCLQERFGLQAFRDGQRHVIERLLAGKSAAAIFPTGGGKSLCYQMPAVLLDGLTLVVSPLLALMREQVDALNARNMPAARLDSSLSAEESRQVMSAVREGHTKLLYVAPERFFNERFREFIRGLPIALFAVDEAHCISQWGHNFRPDYLKLALIAKELSAERVLALTATATPVVLDDICREFAIQHQDAVQTQFYRQNLSLRFTFTDRKSRDKLLVERLQNSAVRPALVYVTLQKTAEDIAGLLEQAALPAKAYHAGLDSQVRESIQDWFMRADDAIVVATIAFGMGIDKPNIRAIYHYNPSKSLENLAQEIGRAGRDGLESECETLLVPEDRVVLENFAYGDTPGIAAVRRFVQILAGQPERFFVSYYSLAYEADIRESVVRTLLTYLELQQVLVATAPRYENYKFKPLVSSTSILSHFEGERRQFASSVLMLTVKKKIWFEISIPQAANRLKCDRTRIVRMLDFFAEKGWIDLQVSGLVHGYQRLKPMGDPEQLTQELYQYAMDREVGEIGRLDEIFQLMVSDSCQNAALSSHFGQPMDSACGHCSVCEGRAIGELPEPDFPRMGDAATAAIKRLSKQHQDVLGDARSQARFLCGLSSPRMIRARLTSDPMYGCCSEIPFDRVMNGLLGIE